MRITILLLTLITVQTLSAQTFFPWPANTLHQELAFNEANECYIFFDNPSGDTLRLKWRQLELQLPDGWTADLCDYGLCYTGIPANGIMNPVYDTIRPYLKLIVQPHQIPGSAWLWFRAIEIGHDANFQDVYFSLTTPGTVAVSNPAPAAVRVFPNPASTELVLENNTAESLPLRFWDFSGRLLWQSVLAPGASEKKSLLPYPDGLYYLQMPHKTERILIQK